MLLNRLVLPFLLLLAAFDALGAQATARRTGAADPRARSGTWSATSTSGLALMGSWTAVPDSTGAAVTGTWTAVDMEGRTVAEGGWSASKSAARWEGAWRAVIAGRDGEHSGTWSATLDLRGTRRFADLFERAIGTVVGGTWRSGGRSGAWSIRAAAREGSP